VVGRELLTICPDGEDHQGYGREIRREGGLDNGRISMVCVSRRLTVRVMMVIMG
jgi:hypothetical protein